MFALHDVGGKEPDILLVLKDIWRKQFPGNVSLFRLCPWTKWKRAA
jgi:hypothetical protein